MTSREAQNSFGSFLDTAQREPVMVTRHRRPVGVMLSMDNLPEAIFDLADSMREQIKAGVNAGLADAEAGRMQVLNDQLVDNLVAEFRQGVEAKS